MNTLISRIAMVAAAAGIGTCLVIQHHSAAVLRERISVLSLQATDLADLSEENRRLSSLAETLNRTQSLSRDQLLELMRLRNRMGELRQITMAKSRIEATNTRLREIESKRQKEFTTAEALPNYWPKNQLAYSGSATPSDALKSMLWAMTSGNVDAWKSNCTPDAISAMERESRRDGRTEEQQLEQIRSMGAALTSLASGFHIVQEFSPTPDDDAIYLSFDGENATRRFAFKRIGGAWKFDEILLVGEGSTN